MIALLALALLALGYTIVEMSTQEAGDPVVHVDGIEDALPQASGRTRPTVLRLDPRSEPIMALSIAGDVPLPDLKELTDQVLRRRLEQIDGVAQAAVTGGLDREIVETDISVGDRPPLREVLARTRPVAR